MLTQQEADELLSLVKTLVKLNEPITFPNMGQQISLDAHDVEVQRKTFKIDINRKALTISKCTYQTRHDGTILLRLDTGGPDHTNPDKTVIPCPHLHIYRQGFRDKWAYPLQDHIITDTNDLVQVLIDFLEYNNIREENRPEISGSGGLL